MPNNLAPDAKRRGPELVSVVLSFRNEAENIPELIARLSAVFAKVSVPYELLFVNDASTDDSLSILLREREKNERVKIINMSHRFGVSPAILAGFSAATGDAVVYMDSDLQDPPESIPEMIERWREGAEVVHTVRSKRHGESALKMLATRLAYRLIQRISTVELPLDAGDFKLLSRVAVDHMLRLPESDPYLRGLAVWIGFSQAFVLYERQARHSGTTHFPFFSKNHWKTVVVGITSFSFFPIYALFALVGLGLLASVGLLAAGELLYGVLTFFWATTIGAIGIVGIYIIRIYKDVRGRPPYIVSSMIGVSARG